MSTKGKERAAYYDEEEGEEEGGIIEEDGLQEDASSTGAAAAVEAAAKAVPIVKRPTHQESWTPKHVRDRPRPPSKEEREAEIALLEAQARAGQNSNDPRARARIKPRRTVDHFGPLARWKLLRTLSKYPGSMPVLKPDPNYVIDIMPPAAYPCNISTSYCTKYVHTSSNKQRSPVNCIRWTPEGRRVVTGCASGEFTLWNGLTFNFETILQAHDVAVRCFEWSHSGEWLVSCDGNGTIKYFAPNMNNVRMFSGHAESIRDISFAPNDARFATASNDNTIKIWDFERTEAERTLTGHGYDVLSMKWHPTKALLASGSKNNIVKFWDPRSGKDLRTLHDHKGSVQALNWCPNGNMVATASRDQSVKVFDIRMMKVVQDFRGHPKDVTSVVWHPIHHEYLVSGGFDGSILHWHMDSSSPVDTLIQAHDQQIWALAFHPLGHMLASAANDTTTRWWSRGRPGVSIMNDRFHLGRERAHEMGQKEEEEADDDDEYAALPGLGGAGRGNNPNLAFSSGSASIPNFSMTTTGGGFAGGESIPGLDASSNRGTQGGGIPGLSHTQQQQYSQQQPGTMSGYGGSNTWTRTGAPPMGQDSGWQQLPGPPQQGGWQQPMRPNNQGGRFQPY